MDSFESKSAHLAESEKGMLWEPRVIESRREPVEGFKEKGKRRASILLSFSLSWFSVIHVFMSSVHELSCLVRLVASLRGTDFWSCVIWENVTVYRVVSYDIGEEHGHYYWALTCNGDEDQLLTEVDWYLSERYDWNNWSAVDWIPKTEFRRERRIWWSVVSKAAERSNKRRTEMLSLSRVERISFTICNKTVSVLYPAR